MTFSGHHFSASDRLLAFLESHFPLIEPQSRKNLLEAWNREVLLKKGQRLETSSSQEPGLYFVVQGCMKAASETSEQELIFEFAWSGHCFFNLPRFLNPKTEGVYLEAIHPSKLLAISKADFMHVLAKDAMLHAYWQQNLQKILLGRLQRESLFMHANPAERIQWLRSTHPEILEQVPKVHIASYLGIRPETLSRAIKA